MQDDRNTYVLDAHDSTEMARLLDQGRVLSEEMGGVLAGLSQEDLVPVFAVLDLACGPGGWVHEVASLHPDMQVIGVDISEAMITYARAHAEVQNLVNTRFQVMNITRPLEFADESFDLVNARLISGVFYPEQWLLLLGECRRILRPGGILCLTEGEWGLVTIPSEAVERFLWLGNQAMRIAGRSFTTGGHLLGITAVLKQLVRAAGFEGMRHVAYAIDYSYGVRAHTSVCTNYSLLFRLGQPFIIKQGLATQEELNILYEQAMREMQAAEFCAQLWLLTVVGKKPASVYDSVA